VVGAVCFVLARLDFVIGDCPIGEGIDKASHPLQAFPFRFAVYLFLLHHLFGVVVGLLLGFVAL
jgi:hypothetical protein